jgi:hypothetical protein
MLGDVTGHKKISDDHPRLFLLLIVLDLANIFIIIFIISIVIRTLGCLKVEFGSVTSPATGAQRNPGKAVFLVYRAVHLTLILFSSTSNST